MKEIDTTGCRAWKKDWGEVGERFLSLWQAEPHDYLLAS